MMIADDVLLTRKQVAELLSVSQSTLGNWAAKGDGPPVVWLTPNVPRYLRSDVEAYIERNRSGGR